MVEVESSYNINNNNLAFRLHLLRLAVFIKRMFEASCMK